MTALAQRVEEALMGVRFAAALPRFLGTPPTSVGALEVVRARMGSRAAAFLDLVRDQIFASTDSPYLPLLRNAGCEFGDVQALVEREGLEDALHTLFRRGVYLATDEFKGHVPVVRGSLSYTASPRSFRNRRATGHVTVTSGGSTGPVRGHLLDLATLKDLSVDYGLFLDALGASAESFGCWDTAGPVTTANHLWFAAYFGRPMSRSFRLDGGGNPGRAVYASGAILAVVGRLCGHRFPPPEPAPLDDPTPVVRWLSAELRRGARPGLRTFPTSALRLAKAAIDHGVDLSGAFVVVAGEPLTAARLEVIRRSGLRVASLYGASECGAIGFGCLAPTEVDDVHLQQDLHAILRVETGETRPACPEGSLLLTSLRPTARLVLLNTSIGDSAVVERRDCGCALQAVGGTTHLHTIRSHDKINSAGMTFRAHDVVRVIEEVLPLRFGGTPADYQLAEGESEGGEPRVVLRIHPAVGVVDVDEAKRTFLESIAGASDINAVMAKVWSDGDVLRVRRESPVPTAGGKLPAFQRGAAGHEPGPGSSGA